MENKLYVDLKKCLLTPSGTQLRKLMLVEKAKNLSKKVQ